MKLLDELACVWTSALLSRKNLMRILILLLLILMHIILVLLYLDHGADVDVRIFKHFRRAAQDIVILTSVLDLRL